MQHAAGASILTHLAMVEAERAARAADPDFAARVSAIKAYQQRRFAHAYADLLDHPRYAGAARFFLDELYGPADFTQRDAQFARIVPALVRLFPAEVIDAVLTLAQLHALSEGLDSTMARALGTAHVDASTYVLAWQRCGQPAQRETQIALILRVGTDLDRLTHNAVLRHSLRLMRAPARAAGLGALQTFLESGFDTFRAMGGADAFLRDVGRRERALAVALFSIDPRDAPRLGQLP
jgi:hypothetical protein